MDQVIIRAIEGLAEPEELEALGRWRAESPENERRYREVSALWRLTGERSEIDPAPPIPKVATLLDPEWAGSRSARTQRRLPAKAVAVAALFLVALGVGHFMLSSGADELRVAERFEAGSVEPVTVTLDDGSVARLAPGTTLEVEMDSDGRRLHLDGRAYFAVQAEERREFVVHAGGGTARVLGTRFEVDSGNDRLRVMVVDGRVVMATGAGESELGSGDVGEASDDQSLTVHRVTDPERRLEWMGAWIGLTATPLSRVAEELGSRFEIAFDFVDPALGERTISGWFADDDVDHMVEVICRAAAVACRTDADTVRVEPLP
jgi:transmembrane sensor